MNRDLRLRRKAGLVERATAIPICGGRGRTDERRTAQSLTGWMGQAEEPVGGSWRGGDGAHGERINLRMLLSAAWRRSIAARRRTRKGHLLLPLRAHG